MDVKEAIKKVEKSEIFKNFKEDHKDIFLANAFTFIESNKTAISWHVGYYHPKESVVTSFVVKDDNIEFIPKNEVLKSGEGIHKIDLSNVKLSSSHALIEASNLQKKKYPAQQPIKIIMILQCSTARPIYNITYLTTTFSTLNIKIDAENGKVLIDSLAKLFDMNPKDISNIQKKVKKE